MAASLKATVENLEKGTARCNELMQAARHNFLFRKYFRKQKSREETDVTHAEEKSQREKADTAGSH